MQGILCQVSNLASPCNEKNFILPSFDLKEMSVRREVVMVARKLSLWQNKPETQCITCTYSGHIPALLLEKYVAPDIQMPSLLGHPYHKRWCVRSVSHRVSSDTDFVTLGRLSFFCYRMRQFKVYKTSRQLRKQIKMETSP